MLFNSFEFAIFFPIVTLLYFLLPQKLRVPLLLIASCVFYMAFRSERIEVDAVQFVRVRDFFSDRHAAVLSAPAKITGAIAAHCELRVLHGIQIGKDRSRCCSIRSSSRFFFRSSRCCTFCSRKNYGCHCCSLRAACSTWHSDRKGSK